MLRVLLCVCGFFVAFSSGSLAAFDPICCSTSLDELGRLLLIPDEDGTDPHPAGTFWVTIRNNACDPIPNATVEVLVGGQAHGKVKLCGSVEAVELNPPVGG
jgi:hypothetical protein